MFFGDHRKEQQPVLLQSTLPSGPPPCPMPRPTPCSPLNSAQRPSASRRYQVAHRAKRRQAARLPSGMVIDYRRIFGAGLEANGTRETSGYWVRRINHLSRLSSFFNDYKPGVARCGFGYGPYVAVHPVALWYRLDQKEIYDGRSTKG